MPIIQKNAQTATSDLLPSTCQSEPPESRKSQTHRSNIWLNAAQELSPARFLPRKSETVESSLLFGPALKAPGSITGSLPGLCAVSCCRVMWLSSISSLVLFWLHTQHQGALLHFTFPVLVCYSICYSPFSSARGWLQPS